MTPQEHNKWVGLAQLGYAVFYLLAMIVFMGFEGFMLTNIYSRSQAMGGPPLPALFLIVFVLVGIITVVMTVPSIVAGYALLKRRSWAKIAAIIGGVLAATSFPIGTAVAVYTFWFLFSDVGRQIYGGPSRELPPPPPKEWQPNSSNSAQDWPSYTPPPNWR